MILYKIVHSYMIKNVQFYVDIYISDDLGKNGYMKEFMRGTIYRKNCYECSYARNERISDLTIGDFWGLGEDSKLLNDKESGISLLLPVSKKGDELVKILSYNGVIEERTLYEAFSGNAQLNYPTKKTNECYIIRNNISKGINKAYKKCRTRREVLRDIPLLRFIYIKIRYGRKKSI